MKPFAVLYATREGHTRRIAERIEAAIRNRGRSARIRDVREIHEPFDLDRYAGAVVAASVHTGKHEPEIVEFVKRHRDKLEDMKAAFVSVSLSEARAEDKRQSEDDRSKATADVQGVIDKFLAETGWRPKRAQAVAGALLYSKYNFIVRFLLKRVAKKASLATDSSRDYEFTDWEALDRLVDDVLSDHGAPTASQGVPALA